MNASSIGTVLLTALLLSGCKKPLPAEPATATNAASAATHATPAANNATPETATNATPESANPSAAVVSPRGKDLGVIQLTNRYETQIQVGDGKSCTIKPLLQDPQHVRLTMTLESRMADGKTRGLKIITVVARPDQPFEVDFGSLVFTLTPRMITPPAQ